MEMVINPAYEALADFVRALPRRFEREGRILYQGRNQIKLFEVDGKELNVKRYHIPSGPNRIIYSYWRRPKAVRAYRHALQLEAKGFDTPSPIAYILCTRGSLLSESYFICPQYDGNTLYEIGKHPAEENADIFRALGAYTARLHEAGIYHTDFSPGNILFRRTSEGIHFALIDINRMRFGKVSVRKGCANFARLWGREAAFRLMADTYAQARQTDAKECLQDILYARDRFWRRYARKHEIEFELT